ncbi:MAG: hypothetical protein HY592_06130 [Candidatus Omnitrophica bacterium]|nr:hypothetical protein [Candidatus Omnitrophota bacterium]
MKLAWKAHSVIDFGPKTVIALCAEKKADGSFHLLGGAEIPLQGTRNGQVTHTGDAVECVREALKKVRQAAGVSLGSVYFNFDDPGLSSIRSRADKLLAGEGEVRRSDIREVCEMARRLAADFEKSVVYAKEIEFLIDDKDPVANPLGVFGRKLDVTMHLLLANAARLCQWRKVFERCGVNQAVPIPSAWSIARGVISSEEASGTEVVFDAGADFLNGVVWENGAIQECVTQEGRGSMAPWVKNWEAMIQRAGSVKVTGDLASDESWVEGLRSQWNVPIQRALPLGLSKLTDPKHAAIVGLVHVADEMQKKTPRVYRGAGILGRNMRERMKMFIQEYF